MIIKMIKAIGRLLKCLLSLTVTIGLIAGCLYVDARYIEPRLLKTNELELFTDQIKLTKPLKIVQFSDTHLGEYYALKDFQHAVKLINQQAPDIIIFSGDLMDDHKEFTEDQALAAMLQQLKSTYGKFAVYGNHDHGSNGTKHYAHLMEAGGFTVLNNAHYEITLDNQSVISLIGIDDIVLSKPDLQQAFSNVPENAYKLFISHAPDVAEQAASYGADLQLSGHTHGGQVRLPFLGALSTPPYGKKYVKGLYHIGNMPLYVSSGIGTSQLPFRFCNLPEIAVFTLSNPA